MLKMQTTNELPMEFNNVQWSYFPNRDKFPEVFIQQFDEDMWALFNNNFYSVDTYEQILIMCVEIVNKSNKLASTA